MTLVKAQTLPGENPEVGTSHRALVVDPDRTIVDAIAASLRDEGMAVDEAVDGAAALAAARSDPPDVIVLDVTSPDLNGMEIARQLRTEGVRGSFLYLTRRHSWIARLTVGGDDCLARPFSLGEISARVHAVLRRTGAEPFDGGLHQFADIELDELAHLVKRGGQMISFTPTEFQLLRYFLLNPRSVLSKAQILHYVWHYDYAGGANVVEVYVGLVRKKLETVGSRVIFTIRLKGSQGGYQLVTQHDLRGTEVHPPIALSVRSVRGLSESLQHFGSDNRVNGERHLEGGIVRYVPNC
jgi:two-component system OmpR family response regulator